MFVTSIIVMESKWLNVCNLYKVMESKWLNVCYLYKFMESKWLNVCNVYRVIVNSYFWRGDFKTVHKTDVEPSESSLCHT